LFLVIRREYVYKEGVKHKRLEGDKHKRFWELSMSVKKEEKVFGSGNNSLKSEVFQKFLEICINKIDDLDGDLSLALDQMEAEARERTVNYYYEVIGKYFY